MRAKRCSKWWRGGVPVALRLASAGLAAVGPTAADDAPKEPSDADRARLEKRVQELNEKLDTLYQQGQIDEARKPGEEAMALARQLFPPERYPDGHPPPAPSLNAPGARLQ